MNGMGSMWISLWTNLSRLCASCLCRIQVSLANLKPVNPVPACQVTPMSQGGSSEQYATDQGEFTEGNLFLLLSFSEPNEMNVNIRL